MFQFVVHSVLLLVKNAIIDEDVLPAQARSASAVGTENDDVTRDCFLFPSFLSTPPVSTASLTASCASLARLVLSIDRPVTVLHSPCLFPRIIDILLRATRILL